MDCPVCFVGLAEGDRLPKVLPCGHTFCSQCVERMFTRQGRGPLTVTCPTCRTIAPESEISTNFALRDLLQSVSRPCSDLTRPLLEQMTPSAPPQDLSPQVRASAAQALQAPQQDSMDAPWAVGPQNMYEQAHQAAQQFPVPTSLSPDQVEWVKNRREALMDWGKRREAFMHRPPNFLMDQMLSGSGFYPIRLLESSWLLPHEQQMVSALEGLLVNTGNARDLGRDMLTPLIYGIDVRIILDNSGSMQLDMFGLDPSLNSGSNDQTWIDRTSRQNESFLRQVYANMRQPGRNAAIAPPNSLLSPHHRRWFFARDALSRWMEVYKILGIDPWVYLLNPTRHNPNGKVRGSQLPMVFTQQPQGRTPMTQALEAALQDHQSDAPNTTLLLLVVTDGEADDMQSFNALLDRVQNNVYGDVQVCFMGLSLVPRDIEWFENEECDETRIRTVEAYEVEQRQIQLREVVRREGLYNFQMHTYRVLVTNFFPADYDYEAPLQNLRHRLYITLHGRDRWYGLNSMLWRVLCSHLLCAACFLGTCAHCNGWCQGNDCGKFQKPEMLENCCGEE